MIPYAAATSGDKALVDLQKILEKFGCLSFGTMTNIEKGITMVQFKWRDRTVSLEASWKGYAEVLMRSKPFRRSVRGRQVSEQDYRNRAMAQGKISVCSVLRDWIKGQVTAVECGIMSFETAFMPHILLSNGKRVIDIVQAKNLLEAPKE